MHFRVYPKEQIMGHYLDYAIANRAGVQNSICNFYNARLVLEAPLCRELLLSLANGKVSIQILSTTFRRSGPALT